MSKVRILDAEFELNLFNFAEAKRLEQALEQFEQVRSDLTRNSAELKPSAMIKQLCTAVFDCINSIFGKGAAQTVFGTECDLLQCCKAMAQLYQNIADAQSGELHDSLAAYLPQ